MAINKERILELLQLLQGSSAAELSVREGEQLIRLARPVQVAWPTMAEAPAGEADEAAPQPYPPLTTANTTGSPAVAVDAVTPVATATSPPVANPTAEATDDQLVRVKARVVGLFHRSKVAGEQPLVEVGQRVGEGQILGIIDVLRKPTEIASPVVGEVVEIIFEDGHGVQYGDDLFVIKPELPE